MRLWKVPLPSSSMETDGKSMEIDGKSMETDGKSMETDGKSMEIDGKSIGKSIGNRWKIGTSKTSKKTMNGNEWIVHVFFRRVLFLGVNFSETELFFLDRRLGLEVHDCFLFYK